MSITKIKNKVLFVLLTATIFIFSCKKETDRKVTNHLFEAQLENAIWCYYESNFMKDKIAFMKERKNGIIDTNVCFIDGLMIDTTYYGDTLEFLFVPYIGNMELCNVVGGFSFGIFGFYPNSDTVSYRRNISYSKIRKPKIDSVLAAEGLYKERKVLPMNEQRVQFKQFIIENQDKLNAWLKKQAYKRGHIDEYSLFDAMRYPRIVFDTFPDAPTSIIPR